jgi:hypothetical protein
VRNAQIGGMSGHGKILWQGFTGSGYVVKALYIRIPDGRGARIQLKLLLVYNIMPQNAGELNIIEAH